MPRIETCIFCHKSSEFIGRLEDVNDDESYCPFCGATQLEAAKKMAGLAAISINLIRDIIQYVLDHGTNAAAVLEEWKKDPIEVDAAEKDFSITITER